MEEGWKPLGIFDGDHAAFKSEAERQGVTMSGLFHEWVQALADMEDDEVVVIQRRGDDLDVQTYENVDKLEDTGDMVQIEFDA
jgi:hypothetical protein